MKVYHFTEQPYPDAWKDHGGSLRVNLPNRKCDPAIAADLLHRYYDEWLLADELGYDIMLNEHHQTATCMSSTVIVGLSVLARQTKRARLLVLGYPIGHRGDPLRVAEELSNIDVISRGRLDMGFIKGVPYEFAASNQNPVGVMDRFWEAHDFILKAMTTHDGPFNWESEHFHYRQVNIWPRPWQQPHPPIWSTTGTKSNARVLGEHGYVMATLGTGYNTRPLFDAYREGYMAKGRPAPSADRFAYLGLVAVASNEREALARGELLASYPRTSSIVYPPFRNPPGYLSVEDNARMLRGETPPRSFTRSGHAIDMRTASVPELIEAGILFCGTPDQVYAQLDEFCDYCGGMGNLLMMGHAGPMSHADTVDNLTLFAKEVLPRLTQHKEPAAATTATAA
jgi:alkanesulfonate monooxygenase SsuD/methylene tetrahydromethanopterin reductase-like flavin-dependent oxidoreductase (luciferase family)